MIVVPFFAFVVRRRPGTLVEQTYGDFSVVLKARVVKESYTLRTFLLQAGTEEVRQIKHFAFTAWPDHGVPKDTRATLAMYWHVKVCFYIGREKNSEERQRTGRKRGIDAQKYRDLAQEA